jgi:hypothetical protein
MTLELPSMADVAINEPLVVCGFEDVGEESNGDEDFYPPPK